MFPSALFNVKFIRKTIINFKHLYIYNSSMLAWNKIQLAKNTTLVSAVRLIFVELCSFVLYATKVY